MGAHRDLDLGWSLGTMTDPPLLGRRARPRVVAGTSPPRPSPLGELRDLRGAADLSEKRLQVLLEQDLSLRRSDWRQGLWAFPTATS